MTEPIVGYLHRFDLANRNEDNPLMRRFRAWCCDCQWKGPWQRDRDSAIEDGYAHQDGQT